MLKSPRITSLVKVGHIVVSRLVKSEMKVLFAFGGL